MEWLMQLGLKNVLIDQYESSETIATQTKKMSTNYTTEPKL